MKRKDYIDELKRAAPSKMSKRFVACFVDMVLVIVVTLGLFSFIFGVTSNSNTYIEQANIVTNEVEYYKKLSEESHLVEYENTYRVNGDDIADKNIHRAIYLSYLVFGNEQRPDFKFDEGHEITSYGIASSTTDNVAYFYTQYVPNNEGIQIDMRGLNPVEFLFDVYRTSFGEDANFMFTFNKEKSLVPILNTQVAYYMFHYLYISQEDAIGQTGMSYYQAYVNAYILMLQDAENILANSEPYHSEHFMVYKKALINQARQVNTCLIISIVISCLLCLLLPKYLFRYERTIGYRIFGLGVVNQLKEENPWYIVLIKTLFDCVGFLTVSIVLYLFEPFNGVFDAMFLPFTLDSKVSLGIIVLICGVLGMLVNIVGLFTHSKQNLLNLIFKDKVVDIHYLDEGDKDDEFEGRPY